MNTKYELLENDTKEWCSHKENTNHAISLRLYKPEERQYKYHNKTRDRAVMDLLRIGYRNYEIAEAFGFVIANVTKIKNNYELNQLRK